MTLSQKQFFYLGLIILFLSVIVLSIYQMLGGFEEIKVYKLDPITRTIAGKRFVTNYNDEAPRDFGIKCRALLDSGDMTGELVIVNYLSDTLPENQIHHFIGISLSEDMFEIPQGFQVEEFTSTDRYAVFLSMHVLVQPRPHKIEAMLWERAREDGAELEDFFFEVRYPDNSLSVEGWAKQ